MEHISHWSRKNDRCLIIGNGHSANEVKGFDLKLTDVISCNYAFPSADLFVYYDREMMEHFSRTKVKGEVAGFRHGSIDHTLAFGDKNKGSFCDYYYTMDDFCGVMDTGFNTIYFADKIWDYPEIYFIGIDYWIKVDNGPNSTYHYNEKRSDMYKMLKFITYSVKAVQKYYTIEWKNSIINLGQQSQLDIYPKKRMSEVFNATRASRT